MRYATKMHDRYEPFWFFIPVILGGLFPWTAALFLSYKNIFARRRDVIFLSCWFFVMLLFFSASSSKLIPYIIPLLPPLAVITARNLLDAVKENSRAKMLALQIFFAVFALALIAAAAIVLGRRVYIKNMEDVLLYKTAIINITLLSAGFAALFCFIVKNNGRRVALLCLYALLFAAFAKPGFVTISKERSTRAVAQAMLKYLQPQDIVVNYDYYYQDMPFYLKRRVVITGWRGELEYGITQAAPRERARWFIARPDVPALLTRPLEDGQKMYFVVRQRHHNHYPLKEQTKLIEKTGEYYIYVREQ